MEREDALYVSDVVCSLFVVDMKCGDEVGRERIVGVNEEVAIRIRRVVAAFV